MLGFTFFLFFITTVSLIICAVVVSPPVSAAVITASSQTFYPSDSTIVYPAQSLTYKGEEVMGVNGSLGCGVSDPVGKYKSTGYFEFNFSTPVEYMYRLRVRSYSPDTLSNTLWMWFTEGANYPAPASVMQLETTPANSTTRDFKVDNTHCLHIGATTTYNNTMRFYAREPGVLVAWFNLSMIAPPQILRAFSMCGGECNLDQPLPIRIETSGICFARDADSSYGNLIISGAGGKYECIARDSARGASSVSVVDCLVPPSIAQGNTDIKVSLNWPSFSAMPNPQSDFPIAVSKAVPNLLWVIAPAVVGFLIIAFVAHNLYKKWKATKNAPRNAASFSAMWIVARRVALLWEKAPNTTGEALRVFDKIVREACERHNCYIDRKVGDSYLVVAHDPAQNFAAAAEVQAKIHGVNWYKVITGNDVPLAIADAVKKRRNNKSADATRSRNRTNTSYRSADGDAEDGEDVSHSVSNSEDVSHSVNNSGNMLHVVHSAAAPDQDSDVRNIPFMEGDALGGGTVVPRAAAGSNPAKNSSINNTPRHTNASESVRSGSMATSHSSQRTRTVVETGVQCSIAIANGKGRIVTHEAGTSSDYESYEYSGDVVDEAAAIVDLAFARQILSLEPVQTTVKAANASLPGTFTALAAKIIKGKNFKFVQFNPAGLEVLGCGLQEETETVDSIQAQLDAASSGFSQKVCTILYLELHGLIQQAEAEIDDRKAFLEKYKGLYKPINDIIKHTGGTLINITSSNLVVAFNAFSPSPMHVTRAATCHFKLRALFSSTSIIKAFALGKLGFCAGLATGQCVVGTLESDKSHKQIFGSAWEQAQELMRMSRAYALDGTLTCPCFAVWNSRSDLNHSTQFQFVDLVTSRRSANVAAPGHQPSHTSSSPSGPRFLRGIVCLMSESNAGSDDDDREWMYDLEHQDNSNPYFHANEAYVWLLGDFVGDAEDRWVTLLKDKLATNENDEVNKNQMVGLRRLAEVFAAGWSAFSASVHVNERL